MSDNDGSVSPGRREPDECSARAPELSPPALARTVTDASLAPDAPGTAASGNAIDASPASASLPDGVPAAAETPPTQLAAVDAPLPPPLLSDPSVAPAAGVTTPTPQPLIFHGCAKEYFRIWIVNTLLTLLTAGVFLAWAKVRKRRYLRGSLELLGHRFDYRARPERLLIGHAFMAALFLAYSLFGAVYPVIRYGALAVMVVLLPWIVVRSLSFNAHNTAYRGMRFRFNPSLSAAFLVFLLEPLLLLVTAGLYYPAWQRSRRAYVISNHRLGDAYFHFEGDRGPFYLAYLLAGAIVFVAALVAGAVVVSMGIKNNGVNLGVLQWLPFIIVYAAGFFLAREVIHALLFNHTWNHTRLDEHRFVATMRTSRWLGLQLTNAGAILLSAGLLYPWSVIRAQRYAASCLSFVPAGPIDSIQRVGGRDGSATGDAAAEFVGLDFGL